MCYMKLNIILVHIQADRTIKFINASKKNVTLDRASTE